MPTVLWFRRDLRVNDNPALLAAVAAARADGDGVVTALFVLDSALWGPAGAVRRAALLDALRALDASIGDSLLMRHGAPADVVPAVAQAAGARSVHIAADFGVYGMQRDAQVEAALAERGIELIRTGSPYAVGPGRVLKGDGTPYRVYTPFYKAWLAHGWRQPADDAPTDITWAAPDGCDGYPDRPDLGSLELPEVSEAAARARWHDFRGAGTNAYQQLRDRADLSGTSKLSADLKWGTIHPRTLLADLDDSEGDTVFGKEIAWREFYADVLFHNLASRHDNLDTRFNHMVFAEGPEADAAFDLWCQGRTGYPFVDAGMRQLLAEGWMHNRVRMVVASFLVKDLHLPWWRGAKWFMRNLADGDGASNTHGWQWTAGCGTDASPYFRVFNPVTQGKRFDPEGDYVRRYIPELAHISGASAHEPWLAADGYANGYSEQIVNHAMEREEALRRFSDLPPRS